MVLTPAEKQRRYRERLKSRERSAPDLSADAVTRSFSQFIAEDGEAQFVMSFMDETLASIGLQRLDLQKDEDPEWDPNWGTPNTGSLGKATRAVDAFIDCAAHLAEVINRFKLAEVDTALASLKTRNKNSLAEAVRLTRVKERLQREIRRSFKPTTVKGETTE